MTRRTPPPARSLLRLTIFFASLAAVIITSIVSSHQAMAAPQLPSSDPDDSFVSGQLAHFGKSHLVQSSEWYATKLAWRDRVLKYAGSAQTGSTIGPPAAYTLSTYVTGNTFEPWPSGTDSGGHAYTDNYYSKFCGEGATTVALGYWSTLTPINSNGTHSFKDPHTTTTWNDTDNRSYLMYLATQTYPPSFSSAGEVAFGTYPSANTYASDIRDTLNWEASDRNTSTWSAYHYAITWASGFTQASDLMDDVRADIGDDHVADVVAVNTADLPSWSGTGKALQHYVAIVGYNTYNNTFTYVETCGTTCGSDGNGVYTASLSQIYSGIENDGGAGALIW